MLNPIFKYVDKTFIILFSLLFVFQQIFASLSLYLLTELTKIQIIENYLYLYLALFFAAVIFEAYLVIPIRIMETKGCYQNYNKWIDSKFDFLAGQVHFWMNKEKKLKFQTAIGVQMNRSLNGAILCYFEIFKYLLSLLFSGALLSFVLGVETLIIFIFSLLMSGIYYYYAKNSLSDFTKNNQQNEVNFFSYIPTSWDNVLLGNKLNIDRFINKKKILGSHYLKSELDVFKTSEKIVFNSFILAVLPVALFNFYFLEHNIKNLSITMSALILIPRQINLLNNIRAIIQLATYLKRDLESYLALNEESKLKPVELLSLVDFSKILINNIKFDSFDEIKELISKNIKGRFTVRGANGSGKTALLLMIKSTFKDSFYLPANPNLEIDNENENLSTGQTLIAHFNFINQHGDFKILLLDEWDANLDIEITDIYSLEVDKIAQDKIVIEILH